LYRKPQVDDDYSFDPLGVDNGYYGKTTFDCDIGNGGYDRQSPLSAKEQDDYCSQPREDTISPGNPTSLLFARSPSVVETTLETHEDEIPPPFLAQTPTRQREAPSQHVFAPPGKVGVAIDHVDGHPVVHQVKRGSPLEGLLQPNDRVLAIDDVDTTCMSAADVTQLMAKRMNYNRRITFAR